MAPARKRLEAVQVSGVSSLPPRPKSGFFLRDPLPELSPANAPTDLVDKSLLREILDSTGEDICGLQPEELKRLHLEHPMFQGTLVTLMHTVFGIPHRPTTPFRTSTDLGEFVAFVYDDNPPQSLHPAQAEALIGDGEHLSLRTSWRKGGSLPKPLSAPWPISALKMRK